VKQVVIENPVVKSPFKEPNLYIIAGPNGAGKTTFAKEFLPNYVQCLEFVNADLIAGGLSPSILFVATKR